MFFVSGDSGDSGPVAVTTVTSLENRVVTPKLLKTLTVTTVTTPFFLLESIRVNLRADAITSNPPFVSANLMTIPSFVVLFLVAALLQNPQHLCF